MTKIQIYDTTLRDGSQMPGVNFSVQDKLKITSKLMELGVDFVEGGWPGSNPKDEEYFARVRTQPFADRVVAFSSTCLKGKTPATDPLLAKVLAARTGWVTVFGKTWDLHTREILKVSEEQALALIAQTIRFLVRRGKQVIFDAEHFFDGFQSNPDFALRCLAAAAEAGAAYLTLCDTNGGTLPAELVRIVIAVRVELPTPLGIHAHNDSGVAVANSILAVQNGVQLVQGTLNGFGERTGNANLNTIIPNLQLKLGYKIWSPTQLRQLTSLANYIYELANLRPAENQPFVGSVAFAHKGGIHASAVAKLPASYEHIDPRSVGNTSSVTISELSGKSNVIAVGKRLGIKLDPQTASSILTKVKQLENTGLYFETAEASFALLLLREQKNYQAPFQVQDWFVASGGGGKVRATVELQVGSAERHYAASGNGPVNALDTALRRAVIRFFPQLKSVELADYKVRILDSTTATAAKTRVLIESTDGQASWTTVGCSENIIEASFQALTDSLEYAIWRNQKVSRA